MTKKYLLGPSKIKPLAKGHGACVATDRITVEGEKVRFMYREKPMDDQDSGWNFFSGIDEDDDYLDDESNSDVFDVNTIANYCPAIIPYLKAAVGSAFEWDEETEKFVKVVVELLPDEEWPSKN